MENILKNELYQVPMHFLLDSQGCCEVSKRNDELAFNTLFTKHYKTLVAFITTYTRNKDLSEDIVQQSFIVLWNKRRDTMFLGCAKNYLYTIAYNQFVDHYRKSVRKNSLLEEMRIEILRNSIEEDEEVLENRIKKLRVIIDTLPPKCKEILLMSRQQGLKYKEIANRLNLSPRTVEEQIRIALRKIKKTFKEDI
jgi:RNA polymerase sigma-70 factor (family 1)